MYTKGIDDKEEELTEECNAEHPFQFISNLGATLPAFERELDGLEKGASFDFVIPSKEAYGEIDDELMFEIDKKKFYRNGQFDSEHIYEGNIVPMVAEDGQRFNAVIVEVGEDSVTIDLNHPRAGLDLHFVGKVIEHREATSAEITEMVNYLSGGCGGCGGCSGSCGDGGCNSGCGGCGE